MVKSNSSLKCSTSKTWILILPNDALGTEDGDGTPDIVKLRHPRSNLCAEFLFSHDNSTVHEIFSLSEKRSCFINDTIVEHGKIHFSTPVDPLFLILPYLKRAKEEGKVMPLEDLLIDNEFPHTCRLLKSPILKKINLLAERKGCESLNAWMYNEEKVVKWLQKKAENVAKVLKNKKILGDGKATSKYFVKAEANISDEESSLKYACGLVSEYLSPDLSRKLFSSLGLPPDSPGGDTLKKKRKINETSEVQNGKKFKGDEEASIGCTKAEGNTKKTDKTKDKGNAIKKAAAGSMSITSFFKKK